MYKIVTKASAAALLHNTKSQLLASGARGTFSLGMVENISRDPDLFGKNHSEQLFATIESENEIVAISFCIPPLAVNLFCFSQNPPFAPDIISCLANYLHHNWNRNIVNAIFSEFEIAEKFAELWMSLSGKKISKRFHQSMYSLSKVLIKPSSGSLKAATSSDFELVQKWYSEFSVEALQKVFTESDKERLQKRISSGKMFLWISEEGIPVSMAGTPRKTENSNSVGPVYTPVEFRKRGYATSLVAALSQKCLDEGSEMCTLFADMANPTSNKIYHNIGYEKVCELLELSF